MIKETEMESDRQSPYSSLDFDEPLNKKTAFEKIQNWVTFTTWFSSQTLYNPNILFQERITPEIFINICFHLPPADLISLRLVCKYFDRLLGSAFDFPTQRIWEISRLRFCPYQQLPPPEGMSEQEYAKIVMFQHGCQICRDKSETPNVYWAAQVRCCKSCLRQRSMSGRELRKNWDIPSELMGVLVVLTSNDLFGDNLDYYWVFHVSDMINQYIRLEPNKKKNWLKQKRARAESIESDTREREAEDERWLQDKQEEQKLDLEHLIGELRKTIKVDADVSSQEIDLHASKCYEDILAEIEKTPFIPKSWGHIRMDLQREVVECQAESPRSDKFRPNFGFDDLPRNVRTGYNLRKKQKRMQNLIRKLH